MSKILVIGDDNRQKILAKSYNTTAISEKSFSLAWRVKKAKIIIIPLSLPSEKLKNILKCNVLGDTYVFAGLYDQSFEDDILDQGAKLFSLTEEDSFNEENAVPTAEGAVLNAMNQSTKTINGSKCLVLGCGKSGKIIAKTLSDLGAEVDTYDIIFNTIPEQVLSDEQISSIKENQIIINLASDNAGFDPKYRYANIPAKIFPETSAEIMKSEIDKIMSEFSESEGENLAE